MIPVSNAGTVSSIQSKVVHIKKNPSQETKQSTESDKRILKYSDLNAEGFHGEDGQQAQTDEYCSREMETTTEMLEKKQKHSKGNTECFQRAPQCT